MTRRELRAALQALNRALAGEPETDDEDVVGMRQAQRTIHRLLETGQHKTGDR